MGYIFSRSLYKKSFLILFLTLFTGILQPVYGKDKTMMHLRTAKDMLNLRELPNNQQALDRAWVRYRILREEAKRKNDSHLLEIYQRAITAIQHDYTKRIGQQPESKNQGFTSYKPKSPGASSKVPQSKIAPLGTTPFSETSLPNVGGSSKSGTNPPPTNYKGGGQRFLRRYRKAGVLGLCVWAGTWYYTQRKAEEGRESAPKDAINTAVQPKKNKKRNLTPSTWILFFLLLLCGGAAMFVGRRGKRNPENA